MEEVFANPARAFESASHSASHKLQEAIVPEKKVGFLHVVYEQVILIKTHLSILLYPLEFLGDAAQVLLAVPLLHITM